MIRNRLLPILTVAALAVTLAACSSPSTTAGATVTVTETTSGRAAAPETVTVTVTADPSSSAPADDDSGDGPSDQDAATVPLVGTAHPKLSAAAGSPVAIVAQGKYDGTALGGTIPLVVRNNSKIVVHGVEIVGTATDKAGKLVGSGTSQGFKPNTVAPGGLAIGYVYFDDAPAKTATDFKLEVSADDGPDDWSADLPVDKLNGTGGSIVGTATNPTKKEVSGPISIAVMCFDKVGTILSSRMDFAAKDELAAGASSPFSVGLLGDNCPTYLIGASGHQL